MFDKITNQKDTHRMKSLIRICTKLKICAMNGSSFWSYFTPLDRDENFDANPRAALSSPRFNKSRPRSHCGKGQRSRDDRDHLFPASRPPKNEELTLSWPTRGSRGLLRPLFAEVLINRAALGRSTDLSLPFTASPCRRVAFVADSVVTTSPVFAGVDGLSPIFLISSLERKLDNLKQFGAISKR